MAKELEREKLDTVVSMLLRYKGTPRDRLFEYPYRDDESRELIANAETVARRIVAELNRT